MRRKHTHRPGRALATVLAALLGGLVGGGVVYFAAGSRTASVSQPFTEVLRPAAVPLPGTRGSIAEVVERVGPAVVNISTVARRPGGGFPSMEPELRSGEGSGFIINGDEGLVVTNNHVVEGAEEITVTLADKRSFSARVVGNDPVGDVALVRIQDGGKLPAVSFGDSDRLRIGETVIAIGNPLGFQNTVTVGVLSQTGRQLADGHVQGIPLDDLLQTDAAINPGNSGGPLLDDSGLVIGMNTAIISRAQGIGFAVASNAIKRSVSDLIEHRRVIRPWIGVAMGDYQPEQARAQGLSGPNEEGVFIGRINRGQPADRAGLQPGDVLTEANGQRVKTGQELRDVIRKLRPGDKLPLKGYRGTEPRSWTVTIGEMPSPDAIGRQPR